MRQKLALPFLAMVLGSIFTMAAFLPEPWETLLFIVAIPLLQQGLKLYFDRTGKTLGKYANQAISLVLVVVFTALGGGFVGLDWPALPAFDGDIPGVITASLEFISGLILVLGTAWGSMMLLYEAVWDRLITITGAATDDKYY